jgi:flagellar biosynthesis/type III secretory pathway protein FliH
VKSLSRPSRLVRTWANETEPLQLIGESDSPPTLRALPEYHSAESTAREIDAARRTLDELRSRTEAEIQARWDEVRADALAQARDELQAEFEALVDASFQRFNKVVGEARAEQERIAYAAEQDLIELAIGIAHEAIGESVSEDVVERRVRRGLSLLSSSEVTTILVNPNDVALVTPWIERWQQAEGVNVEIVPDRTVEPGGCEVVSRSGIYDLSPQARLEMIGQALRSEFDAGHQ